jgi:hypothetical protein
VSEFCFFEICMTGRRYPAGDLRRALTRLAALGVPGASDSLAMIRGVEDGATVPESRVQPVLLSAGRRGRSPLIDELARLADIRTVSAGEGKRYVLEAIVSLRGGAFEKGQLATAAVSTKARELAAGSVRGRCVAACARPLRRGPGGAAIVVLVYLATTVLRSYLAQALYFEPVRSEDRRLLQVAANRARLALARAVQGDLGAFPEADPPTGLSDDMTFAQLRVFSRATLSKRVAALEDILAKEDPASDVGIALVTAMRAARATIRAVELANFYIALPYTVYLASRVLAGMLWATCVQPLLDEARRRAKLLR